MAERLLEVGSEEVALFDEPERVEVPDCTFAPLRLALVEESDEVLELLSAANAPQLDIAAETRTARIVRLFTMKASVDKVRWPRAGSSARLLPETAIGVPRIACSCPAGGAARSRAMSAEARYFQRTGRARQ